jgi:UDP-N-acetylmuramate dehydrogenase
MAGGMTDVFDTLSAELPGVRRHVPLAPYCAYGVGGPAESLWEAGTDQELVRAAQAARHLDVPLTVLGQATNVLVGDAGVRGLVVLARNRRWRVRDEELTAGAGTVLATLVLDLAEHGLGGLEFAGNIPGSVGGAVVGNAGAYGRAVADVLADADLLVGAALVRVSPAQLELRYRTSVLKRRTPPLTPMAAGELGTEREAANALEDAVVVSARFRLAPGVRSKLLEQIARDAELRRTKHPLEYASCGSFFKNPSPDRPAARLIEEAGLKGLSVGGAQVSERHANFLVALPGASAADIVALAAEVRRRVREQSGVELVEEVVRLGFD